MRHIAPFSSLTASGAPEKKFKIGLDPYLGWLGGHKIRPPLTFSIWACPRKNRDLRLAAPPGGMVASDDIIWLIGCCHLLNLKIDATYDK